MNQKAKTGALKGLLCEHSDLPPFKRMVNRYGVNTNTNYELHISSMEILKMMG